MKGDLKMRKGIAVFALTTFFVLCTVLSSARVLNDEVQPGDAKLISTSPIRERNGKNVALSLEVRPDGPRKLPRGLTILVNNRQVHLYDDGRWPDEQSGDGIYTTAGKTTDGKPLEKKTSFPIRLGQRSNHFVNPLPSIGCTFERVECPKDCTSILFGSKCLICFNLKECSISLF